MIQASIERAKYLVDDEGHKTDVLLPIEDWEALLAEWRRVLDAIEDLEDLGVFGDWLASRDSERATAVSLDEVEREWLADGSVSG